ncbi:MAG: hypothetical protein ACUVRY_06565 [Thermoanaerobaculaceae bacterium]
MRTLRSCITTCLWALGFTFIKAFAQAGEPQVTPVAVANLELETRLAKTANLYLKLDLDRLVLEIKARGLVLDSFHIEALGAAARQPFFIRPRPFRLKVPTDLEVATGPGDTDREVIAPESLRPARRGDEEEEPTPTPTSSSPAPTATKPPETPSRYRVELRGGMLLWVTDRLPARSLSERFMAALREGWYFLFHRQKLDNEPPGLVLVMKTTDAQRLHHLFRGGMRILVVSESLK